MSAADVLPLLQTILQRLAAIEGKIGQQGTSAGGGGGGGGDAGSGPELPRSISAFDAYCTDKLEPFVAVCAKLGGDAESVSILVKEAWGEMRAFLLMAANSQAPADSELPGLFAKMGAKVKAIQTAVQRNAWENHTKTCSEGASACNWLLVKPAPRDFIQSGLEGGEFWANRIRKEFRGVNADQVAFCDAFKALLTDLMAYVKEYHTTGVTWNPKGGKASEYVAGASAPAAPAAPAPAAATTAAAAKPAATTAAAPTANLFAALNKGGDITAGLKTVTKDMQTWRQEYKADTAAPALPKAAPVARPAAAGPKGPAKLEFQAAGSKWVVENQATTQRIEIQGIKETVYIYGCVGASIEIVGKCKSIVVDGCKKTTVIFDAVMASCEIINCVRMHIECREKCAAVAIDKTDGIVVKLPRSSLDTEVVASKSSEMNMQWLDEAGELVERPIPEQYVHRIKEGPSPSITANVSDLYGH